MSAPIAVGGKADSGGLRLAPDRIVAGQDARRYADGRRPGRDVPHDYRVGADLGPVADQDRPQDLRAGAHDHGPPSVGCRLPAFHDVPAQSNAVVERAVVADFGGFADDDAHPVVDEHPPADRRAGVDFDAGQPAAPVRQPAREPARAAAPEAVAHRAVPYQRMQARIAGQHLPGGACGGIALEYDRDVFTESVEHTTIVPYPTESLNY